MTSPGPHLSLLCFLFCVSPVYAGPLRLVADFEGASVASVEIDQQTRTIQFTPGGSPERGWPCWWYFRVEGTEPGETVHLRLRGSDATVKQPGAALQKPLSPSWAMPERATISSDGTQWTHTEKGVREGEWMHYSVRPAGSSFYAAWGPPCTPQDATRWAGEFSQKGEHVQVRELCRSREGRRVPMLRVAEGALPESERVGIWVQARQHAWESGSSWVARGFMEWLLGDSEKAASLRRKAEVFWVPIMDVDNAATGNGGKDALPHDHNRDWSDFPHWNETVAAQSRVQELIRAGRMDFFLDLHNPAPGDPTFFYLLEPSLLQPLMAERQRRFVDMTFGLVSRCKPLIPMSNQPKFTSANYHPRWREISANWVSLHGDPHSVAVCLETIWNSAASNTQGYQTVGACLGEAVADFFLERGRQ